MPHTKVTNAVREINTLKESVKDGVVLTDDTVVNQIMNGNTEQAIMNVAQQMKTFQIAHDEEVVEGAKAGEKLAKGLLEHRRQ